MNPKIRWALGVLPLFLGFVLSGTSWATYSIAATDRATRQVGGSITSCVGSLSLSICYGGAPGRGIIHAQASTHQPGKRMGIMLLEMGVAPADIIKMITATSFDAQATRRQYGVVDLMGRSAGYSGTDNGNYKGDRQGSTGSFAYSVQGNILTSARVLTQSAAGFETGGCDLAERLMRALEAGGENGEGDNRCTSKGIPSDSAYIQVDREGEAAGSYLKLSVQGTGTQNPLVLLRRMFNTWRQTHPCPAAAQDAGLDAGTDAAADAAADAARGEARPEAAVAGDASEGRAKTDPSPDAATDEAMQPSPRPVDGRLRDEAGVDSAASRTDAPVAPADKGAAGRGCRISATDESSGSSLLLVTGMLVAAIMGRRAFALRRERHRES